MNCIKCGMRITNLPEDASYDELLCDAYYEQLALEVISDDFASDE